jgi:hypothetical protein
MSTNKTTTTNNNNNDTTTFHFHSLTQSLQKTSTLEENNTLIKKKTSSSSDPLLSLINDVRDSLTHAERNHTVTNNHLTNTTTDNNNPLHSLRDLTTSLSQEIHHDQTTLQSNSTILSSNQRGNELLSAPRDLLHSLSEVHQQISSSTSTMLPSFLTNIGNNKHSSLDDNPTLPPLQLRLSAISRSAALLHESTLKDMDDNNQLNISNNKFVSKSNNKQQRQKGAKKRDAQRAYAASKNEQIRGNQRTRFEPY